VDAKLKGCTTIHGYISMLANYTGSFVLSNVTSISDGICTYDYDIGESNATLITSIEVKDLTSMSMLSIVKAPLLTTISFPKLSTINDTRLEGHGEAFLNFPSLSAVAEDMTISGRVSRYVARISVYMATPNAFCLTLHFSMNFPVLTRVDGTLKVTSNTYPYPLYYDLKYIPVQKSDNFPLDISFPALQNASSVIFTGNISR
jgi:hypothetical protein